MDFIIVICAFAYIDSLLVNLPSFVGEGFNIWEKNLPLMHNENSLKIVNCHIDYKLKWKLKTVI